MYIKNENDNMKAIAQKVLKEDSLERKVAEGMMGCKLNKMTDGQKQVMLEFLTAFGVKTCAKGLS